MEIRLKCCVLFWLALLNFGPSILAQKPWHYTYAVTKNNIEIRFYPESFASWKSSLKEGHQLRHIVLNKNSVLNETTNRNQNTYFIHYDSITVDSLIKSGDQRAGYIQEALFKNPTPDATISDILVNKSTSENTFLMCMLLIHSDIDLAIHFGLATVIKKPIDSSISLFTCHDISIRDTAHLIIDSDKISQSPLPPKPQLRVTDNLIQIEWKNIINNDINYGFFIERSLDSGRSFEKIHAQPIFIGFESPEKSIIYNDSIGELSGTILYRFQSQSCFHLEPILSDTSGVYYENIQYHPVENLIYTELNDSLVLQWTFYNMDEAQIKGIRIYSSDSMEGFQELIAEIGQPCTQFSLAHNESTKYYWVSVVYPQKDIPGYGLLVNGIDHLGPQAVQLQSSACDSMGIIRVNWRPGKEKDLLGYQIYTSNRRHSEFSNVSKSWTTDTFFVDTLDISWNRDSVYYFIKAADTRYNQSTDDSVVAIAIPVINPPEIPFISSCSEYMGSIRLFIERSPHDRAAFVKVYRKENHGEWLSLALVRKVESSFFIDSHVTSGNYYEYKCCATGNTGIQSGFSPTVSYLLTKTEMLDKIEFSEIWNDTISHKITFKWPKNSFDITAYRIIEVSQGHSKTIATIDGTQTSAQIKYNKPTEGSSYYLIGYTSDGRRSKL